MRTFNTTGPCDPLHHYMLSPLERAPTALKLIREQGYLAVSGPRQSGKTSLIKAVRDAVNADGWARAAVVSCEVAGQQGPAADFGEVERLLVESWCDELAACLPEVAWPPSDEIVAATPGNRFGRALLRFVQACDRPLVLILDEVDALPSEPFLLLLRSIRARYGKGPRLAPHSVVLAGMRSLRDHDLALGGTGHVSPFNIVHFLSMSNFTRDEVAALYAQHTTEKGQRFTDDALAMVWDQTRGQPWLVNALARSCVMELVTDVRSPVEASHVEEAIRRLEAAHPTHLMSLAARLEEERVMRVVAPAILGETDRTLPTQDKLYVRDLGILSEQPGESLGPSNPIYARTLLKLMTEPVRNNLSSVQPVWKGADGRLDLTRLREAFLNFWAQHRGMLAGAISYAEAVPHFGLMTWLDRVANGGGRVDREFAVGRGRLDLLLTYGDQRLPIEVKVHRDDRGDPVPEGLVQLDRYCAGLRVDTGWLVVFDQRTGATGTRLECEEVLTDGGRTVTVIRA